MMTHFDPSAVAREIREARIREASQLRLVRELRRRERPATAPTTIPTTPPHSRLWSLVHLRHAYS
jgi:hypothetical protein